MTKNYGSEIEDEVRQTGSKWNIGIKQYYIEQKIYSWD